MHNYCFSPLTLSVRNTVTRGITKRWLRFSWPTYSMIFLVCVRGTLRVVCVQMTMGMLVSWGVDIPVSVMNTKD